MSDNFTTNPGSGGSTFASDDVGGVQYPRIKQAIGNDGSAADVWTTARLVSAATTNATSVKASAGAVGFIYAVNTSASLRYLKLYNKASAPTVGSDTPVATLPIPASASGAGFSLALHVGAAFSTGIAYAVTSGATDADTGAVGANEVFLWIGYV